MSITKIAFIDVMDLLPGELAARLEADAFFADIPVTVVEKGNLKAEMARREALNIAKVDGKRGAAVLVLQIVADDDYPNLTGGPLTLKPAFHVIENVEMNNDERGTKKSARRIARRIINVLKNFGMHGLVKPLSADKPAIEPFSPDDLGKNMVGYQVNMKCLEGAQETINVVQPPVIAAAATATPQFTLTCPTPNAVIYYTLDDSYPSANNDQALPYTDPVDIPAAGVTVRACAYFPDWIASWVIRAEIDVTLS
ncbi:MAG: hypothetical protein JWR69_81 [Pedosphaera sp.]|nr:hypothetical protein [Pedosphaera sp.]